VLSPVERVFNLNRHPYLPGFDASLHLMNAHRAALLARAKALVQAGSDLWVTGPEGSGRESFVAMLARSCSTDGMPTVCLGHRTQTAPGLLAGLHRALLSEPPPGDEDEIPQMVYTRLLDGLWRKTPLVAVASSDSLTDRDWEEVDILAELEFLGERVVLISACGEGGPPLRTMEVIEVGPPTCEELELILKGRLAMCGGAGFLEGELKAIAGGAKSFSEALNRAAAALSALEFDVASPAGVAEEKAEDPGQLFRAEEILEVGRLFKAISGNEPEE